MKTCGSNQTGWQLTRLAAAAVSLLAGTVALAAPRPVAPSPYSKQATWQETMFAARASVAAQQKQSGATKSFTTPIVRGGEAAQKISVPISDWTDLFLIVDEVGDYHHDVANWAEAKLALSEGRDLYLDTVEPVSVKQGWGQFRRNNQSTVGGPMQIAKQKFDRGLGTHARSVIHYKVPVYAMRFEALVGVDVSRGTNGAVRFIVSPTEGASPASPVDELWPLLARDFPDAVSQRQMRWERQDRIWDKECAGTTELAQRYGRATRGALAPQAAAAAKAGGLAEARRVYYRAKAIADAQAELREFNFQALRRAIEDLRASFGARYPRGADYLDRLGRLEQSVAALAAQPEQIERFATEFEQLKALRQEALLANPLLDFDKLLLVRRKANNLGLPANWQGNSSLPRSGFDNEIAVLSPVAPGGRLTSLYKPEGGKFVGDLKLHFDADRLLFSSLDGQTRWQVFEIRADGSGLCQVTPGDQPDVDNYDACYLPDGRIIFTSTAVFVGVPCVDGRDHVANLYLLERDGRTVRQLCFDQDHNWSPTMLNNGRVLYQRWEYADLPHSQSRLLFHMNPDGTGQTEFYGSNSYWPNSKFYARAIPGHPTKVVAIATGHHGVRRMGELVIFDPAQGRYQADGVVQRIPGYGQKVEAVIRDRLVDDSWPKFLHPYPLSEKYFLVSAQLTPKSLWGVYLVDVFDNLLLLVEQPDQALLEPVPLHRTVRPPVIEDRIDPQRKDGLVYLADIYQGEGLKGVPRGTVKQLRLFAYNWTYRNIGGLLGTVGVDGPWDVRRILGTVPVEADGSAYFRVPANTPITVQPLDAEGKAVQLMRSWMTVMPGENLSCVGCHEKQNSAPASAAALAFVRRAPAEIKPWYGAARGFSYAREVQPVIDRYCVGCHDGKAGPDGKPSLDLRGTVKVADFKLTTPGHAGKHGGKFSVGYVNLHRFVRHPGIESDYHLLTPMEYHADTTELVQLLKKGHHGVQLDAEGWDRIITWVDLNTPYHGNWHEEIGDPGDQRERRSALRKLYAGMDDDPDAVLPASPQPVQFVKPPDEPAPRPEAVRLPGWPFDAAEAVRRQAAAGGPVKRTVELGNGIKLELVLVPAGEFVMGDDVGGNDEQPASVVRIAKSFWMASTETSNEQFAQFAPAHDSRVESKTAYQFGVHGYPLNEPRQPVVRVSWEQTMAFCQWLSQKTGQRFTLPTEAQWEYACRAGAATPFSFGDQGADFSAFANLADAKLSEFASDPYTVCTPLKNPTPYEDYIPKERRWNDGGLLTMTIGSYRPNAWGLHDMHGNAWEWTRSSYRPYPYRDEDGRNDLARAERKVVRGGSWRDRPERARASYRLAYQPWQAVFNVSFRVVCDTGATAERVSQPSPGGLAANQRVGGMQPSVYKP